MKTVDFLKFPGVGNYNKLIYKIQDLVGSGSGTEINIGSTGEIALFADFPVDVRFGDSGRWIENVSEVRFVGTVDKLFVRKQAAPTFGRLVIYVGSPILGVTFSREDPEMKATRCSRTSSAWGSGVTEYDAYTMTLPAVAQEAYYMSFICLERSAGTISGIQIQDTETGLTWVLFRDIKDNPTANYSYYWPRLLRVPTSAKIVVIGSDEVSGTTLYKTFGVVEI